MSGPADPSIDEAFIEVHEQLRSLADLLMRSERADHTLQPTAVVNETYLRLLASPPQAFRDRSHFLAIAATTLRRVLVDHARGRRTLRRGGTRGRTPLEDAPAAPCEITLMSEVAEAIEALAEEDARGAKVVELRTFGGLTMDEIAQHLGVSRPTVERDWRFCRVWLERRLADERAGARLDVAKGGRDA